jgi:amino acid transporter
VIAVISITISLIFGFSMSGPRPLGGVLFLGALVTIFFVPIYIMVALSCTFYFWRRRRAEFNWIKHGVVPVVGAAFFASLGIDFGGLGIAPLAGAARYTPWVVLAWAAVGIAAYPVLRQRRGDAIRQLDHVFLHEDDAETAAVPVVPRDAPA